jgi:hypothetical protein
MCRGIRCIGACRRDMWCGCNAQFRVHHAVDGVAVAAAFHVQWLAPVPQVWRRLAIVRPFIGAGRIHSAAVWMRCPAAAAVGARGRSSAPGGGPVRWQAPLVQGAPAAARHHAAAARVHRLQRTAAGLDASASTGSACSRPTRPSYGNNAHAAAKYRGLCGRCPIFLAAPAVCMLTELLGIPTDTRFPAHQAAGLRGAGGGAGAAGDVPRPQLPVPRQRRQQRRRRRRAPQLHHLLGVPCRLHRIHGPEGPRTVPQCQQRSLQSFALRAQAGNSIGRLQYCK